MNTGCPGGATADTGRRRLIRVAADIWTFTHVTPPCSARATVQTSARQEGGRWHRSLAITRADVGTEHADFRVFRPKIAGLNPAFAATYPTCAGRLNVPPVGGRDMAIYVRNAGGGFRTEVAIRRRGRRG
ncbi:hypothetical protein GCM10009682_30550 [Luedemannella flava]|uniref:Uncharacterized protein n=1 Tax=Luedemannella flava TaxID=349316 RepID=A0ABN2M3F9_9ACTN